MFSNECHAIGTSMHCSLSVIAEEGQKTAAQRQKESNEQTQHPRERIRHIIHF